MDCANSDKVVAMGKQIYEMFQHNVVTDVSIMKPTSVEHYKVEESAGLEQIQAVFEDLDREAALIMISTTTPYDRLGITFKFHTDRIRTIEQLHALSIPCRISEGQHSDTQHDVIFRETPQPGYQDGLKRSAMSGPGRMRLSHTLTPPTQQVTPAPLDKLARVQKSSALRTCFLHRPATVMIS